MICVAVAVVALVVSQHECPRLVGVRYGLAEYGGVCTVSTDCMNNNVIAASVLDKRICYDNRCRGLLEDGLTCSAHSDCLKGACVAINTVSLQAKQLTCTAAGSFAEGSFCTENTYCRDDLFCKEGACSKRPSAGETCYTAVGNKTYTCAKGSTCIVPLLGTIQTAVCTSLKAVGVTGDSCSAVVQCSHEHYCRQLTSTHTCQPLKTSEACTSDAECKGEHGCNQKFCVPYFSVREGGASERNIFCKMGLHAFNNRCVRPLNLDAPCSSDTGCTTAQDGGLLACSCTTGATGVCKYIIPETCYTHVQSFISYESTKYVDTTNYAAIEKSYFCCLKDNLVSGSTPWYLSVLGRYDAGKVDCDDDAVPAWIIIVVLLAVLVCCLALCVTAKLLTSNKKGDDKEEKAEGAPAQTLHESKLRQPPSPSPSPVIETPKKVSKKQNYDTAALEAELRNLAALKDYKIEEKQGGMEGAGSVRSHDVKQKPFCKDFMDCPQIHVAEHRKAFMHQCHARPCPDALDRTHCSYFWHILPSCLSHSCTSTEDSHFLQHRHYCPEGISCSNLDDPVHQQLFRHVTQENPLAAFDRMY